MDNFVALESKGDLYKSLYAVYLDIAKKMENPSLRNQLFAYAIHFGNASSDEKDKQGLEEMQKAGQVECENGKPHKFTKQQRYSLIRGIYKDPNKTLEEKEEYLKAEMQIDYSDVDELRKLQCQACLPDDANKEALWDQYVNRTDMSQSQFSNSSAFFYNQSNEAQCE